MHGPVVIPLVLAVAAITAACFFLNAVFAFAIARPGPPVIRPAFTRARSSLAVVLGWGAAVGLCLGVSTVVFPRWGLWWFAISLSIVIAVLMICYVAVPARLIGMKTTHSKRDKFTLGAVGGAIGAVVCTPPYALGRIGLLMLGSRALFIPGIIVMALGLPADARRSLPTSTSHHPATRTRDLGPDPIRTRPRLSGTSKVLRADLDRCPEPVRQPAASGWQRLLLGHLHRQAPPDTAEVYGSVDTTVQAGGSSRS